MAYLNSIHTPVSVLVADVQAMTARLLITDLLRQRQFRVIECAPEKAAILRYVAESCPEVLLLSAELCKGTEGALEVLKQLRTDHPHIRSVVFLKTAEREVVAELFRAGAKGIFVRSEYNVKRLSRCIQCVAAGQFWATSEQIGFAMDALADSTSFHAVSATGEKLLTKRQEDVVRLVAEGLGNREVAEQLGLSEHTVKNYLFNIFNRLGTSSRTELVMYSISQSDDGRTLPPKFGEESPAASVAPKGESLPLNPRHRYKPQ